MFDLVEEQKRPKIKWWTLPAAALIIFSTGADAGILIGRRNMDPSEWVQVIFLLFMSLAILWPIGRELMARRTEEQEKDDAL